MQLEQIEQTEQIDLDRRYTLAEYFALPDDGYDYDLIGGELVPRNPGPDAPHAKIAGRITILLGMHIGLDDKALGVIYPEASCNLGIVDGNYTKPDISYIEASRIPQGGFLGPITIAPDLIVEINSPTDTVKSIRQKVNGYLAAGVRLVWSVYEDYVLVYRPDSRPTLLFGDDELNGLDVLPGFKLKVSNLLN